MASEYEQIKSAGIDPQVAELAEYHGLGRNVICLLGTLATWSLSTASSDDRATRALDEEMKKRKDTPLSRT